ncbi:transaldolase family protein [Streptomyces sp. NPDC006879]|uniref:transaldolase family protein n=1 Tax=Streptomyces sp. NPDC006879 TaxID=3364767 RepID=UPI003697CAFA
MNTVKRLVSEGVAIWLAVNSEALDAGHVRELVTEGVSGLRLPPGSPWFAHDVQEACSALGPVHERTAGRDGLVSVPPGSWLPGDAGALVAAIRSVRREVDRPNLLVQIPATEDALPAVTACLAEGIGVEVTSICSTRRYGDVVDAFLLGMERARSTGRDLSGIASVASFPLAAFDARIDGLLEKAGTAESKALRGRAGISLARLAHQVREEKFGTHRWAALAAAGARPQRLLWEAAGAAGGPRVDTRYVEELVTRGTVSAMPAATLRAVAEHSLIGGDRVRRHYRRAAQSLHYLKWVGISPEAVARSLEEVGQSVSTGQRARRVTASPVL